MGLLVNHNIVIYVQGSGGKSSREAIFKQVSRLCPNSSDRENR